MQYLLLIYDNEQEFSKLTSSDLGTMMGEYRSLTEDLAKSGHYKGGNQLQPSRAATTVRIRSGVRTTTDGPFAETREQLGGYFMIEASDLDAALRIAERIPAAKSGSIEVRPIVARAM